MVRYVTLAYGDAPGVYRQSLMLLVSLVAHAPEPYELVVATDRPERYVWFGTRIEIEYVDPTLLEAWKGSDPFSMRQKLALLRAAWPDQGYIVLLDADVLARRHLTPFVTALGRRPPLHAQAGVPVRPHAARRQPEALALAPWPYLRHVDNHR